MQASIGEEGRRRGTHHHVRQGAAEAEAAAEAATERETEATGQVEAECGEGITMWKMWLNGLGGMWWCDAWTAGECQRCLRDGMALGL